MGPKGQSKG